MIPNDEFASIDLNILDFNFFANNLSYIIYS